MEFKYFIANKPYNTLCQFTQEVAGQATLADLNYDFPKDVYPIGRLDQDSEGLLLLTNDRALNHRLLNPQFAHKRTYAALIEGIPTAQSLENMENGVDIKIEKKIYHTLPAHCTCIDTPSVFLNNQALWERIPVPRASKNQDMTWVKITLKEGKNRQVRRMCAAIGHPCLRLIRVAIEDLILGDLQPNDVKEVNQNLIFEKLTCR